LKNSETVTHNSVFAANMKRCRMAKSRPAFFVWIPKRRLTETAYNWAFLEVDRVLRRSMTKRYAPSAPN
jgi:hypothetical protein